MTHRKEKESSKIITVNETTKLVNVRDYKKGCRTCKEADEYLQQQRRIKGINSSIEAAKKRQECTHQIREDI